MLMKTIFTLTLIASILLSSIAKATETEPNDTPANANTLTSNGTDSGAINPTGDADWWKVTTTADGRLSLKLKNTGDGSLSLSLYDTAGVILLNGPLHVESQQMSIMQTDGLAAGTFFILIKGSSSVDISSYNISDSLATPKQANDREPNNNVSLAKQLKRNQTITGHIGYYYNGMKDSADWFKLTNSADGFMKIIFKSAKNDTITGNLYDKNGKTLLGSALSTGGIASTIKTDGLAAGVYYVRITTAKGFTAYILTDSLLTYNKYAADKESDKYPYQANILLANSTATGHVSFYNNNKVDSTDYFKLIYTGNNGNLTFTVNILPALSDSLVRGIRFDVFKDTLAPPFSTNLFSQRNNSLNLTSLTTGTYYIRVRGKNQSLGSGSAYSITDSFSVILPTTFISFNGKLNNGEAKLNWSTATEINNKGFEVQKSLNGETFTPIGFVKGAGNSSGINNYSFSDLKLFSGSHYYRLKQIDFDGKFIYSSTIRLNYTKFDWAILGNPVNNSSWLQLQLDKTSHVFVQIISINGKIIQTINKGNISEGTYSIPLNLSSAASGMYGVRLEINDKAYLKKIIK